MLTSLKKYKFIDSLRGIAVLGVILVHTAAWSGYDFQGISGWQIGRGSRGVQLFYLLSAFTLFYSMSVRNQQEKHPVMNFYIRRFFRIAPMFFIAIAYYLLQDGMEPRYWLGDAKGITIANILATFSFVNGFNPYWITSIVPGGWSIAVEMSFYTILPILFKNITNTKRALLFFLLSLLLMKGLYYFLSNHVLITDSRLWHEYLFLYFPSQLPIFALGICLFFISRQFIILNENDSFNKRHYIPHSISWIVFFAAPTIIYLSYLLRGHIIPEHIIFGIAFLFLTYGLSKNDLPILVNPITIFLGKISFSLYLTHNAVLFWLKHFGLLTEHLALNFIITLTITIIFSYITFQLIELPGQRLGKRTISRYGLK